MLDSILFNIQEIASNKPGMHTYLEVMVCIINRGDHGEMITRDGSMRIIWL